MPPTPQAGSLSSGEESRKSDDAPGSQRRPRSAAANSASAPNREERAVLTEARRAAVAVLVDRFLAADLVDADFADLVADAELSEGPKDEYDDDTFPGCNDDLPWGNDDKEEEAGEGGEDFDDGTPRLRIRVILRHFVPPTREEVRREIAVWRRRSRSAKRQGRKGVATSAVGTAMKMKRKKEDEEDSPTKKKRRRIGEEIWEEDNEKEAGGGDLPPPTTGKKTRTPSAAALRNRQRRGDAHFDMMLEELRKFREVHGHSNVPQIAESQTRLGWWAHTMRKHYKWLRDDREQRLRSEEGGGEGGDEEGGTGGAEVAVVASNEDCGRTSKRPRPDPCLNAERIQRLNDLGFKFSMRRAQRNFTWEERFEQLSAAKDELHLTETFQIEDVPHDEVEGLEPGRRVPQDLRSWLEMQGIFHKRISEGRPVKSHEPDRLRRLAELGVIFLNSSKFDARWEKRFGELLQYRDQHGNCLVPKIYPGGLGEWVVKQRKRFGEMVKVAEQRRSDMGGSEEGGALSGDLLVAVTDEKIARLREVGFVFSVRNRRWRKKPEIIFEG